MPQVTPPLLRTPDWLRREYLERGRSQQDLADELGCNSTTISRAIARHGLQRAVVIPLLADGDWLREKYASGLTHAQIAAEVGCAASAVTYAMRRHGIRSRPAARAPTYPELHDPKWLEERLAAGATSASIARELGCHYNTAQQAVRRHRSARSSGHAGVVDEASG